MRANAKTTKPTPTRLWDRLRLLLRAVESGRVALGSTVADVAVMFERERWDGWGPSHRRNMRSVLDFLVHTMVYREPFDDDPADVAAWKRARLALPGVDEGDSLHLALLLAPDLTDAVLLRRTTDLRTDRLNTQAQLRHQRAWARYLAAGTSRGGRRLREPAHAVVLREPRAICEPRTEQLFTVVLGALLATAERAGLLVGPNPWHAFAPKGRPHIGYRRPRRVAINDRNMPPLGLLVDLADAIAELGPRDPRTGRPTGDRFRALVLSTTAGPRPSEQAGLHPSDYRSGSDPELRLAHSAGPASPSVSDDGSGYVVRDRLKGRNPGEVRVVGLARYVADALDAHLERGYASEQFLFTGPEGGPLRFGNITDTYWRPAVAKVFGRSSEPRLREMEYRWLRKAAITWMIRAGLGIDRVSDLTGHSSAVLLAHYLGVVKAYPDHRLWTGWDAAWDWAVAER